MAISSVSVSDRASSGPRQIVLDARVLLRPPGLLEFIANGIDLAQQRWRQTAFLFTLHGMCPPRFAG